MCEKKELRKQFKALREELKSVDKDEKIAKNVLSALNFASYFVYLSFGSEAGTEKIIEGLKLQFRKIGVPLVEGSEMRCVPLTDKLKKGAYGILEPEAGEEMRCDVALVPMLAVDKEGYRLGYGGGYYDKFFATHPHIFKVGIAYEGQRVETLPHEATDIPLDALITEEGVYPFSDLL